MPRELPVFRWGVTYHVLWFPDNLGLNPTAAVVMHIWLLMPPLWSGPCMDLSCSSSWTIFGSTTVDMLPVVQYPHPQISSFFQTWPPIRSVSSITFAFGWGRYDYCLKPNQHIFIYTGYIYTYSIVLNAQMQLCLLLLESMNHVTEAVSVALCTISTRDLFSTISLCRSALPRHTHSSDLQPSDKNVKAPDTLDLGQLFGMAVH